MSTIQAAPAGSREGLNHQRRDAVPCPELLARYVDGLNGPVYYAAGPSGMVAAMANLLNGSGVSVDDVKTEEFGDYKDSESPRR